MAKIVVAEKFDGFDQILARLGLKDDWEEILTALRGIDLRVTEKRDSNGAAVLRKMIDAVFAARLADGWHITKQGGIDWTKTVQRAGVAFKIGIEIQVSGRSDLVAVDLLHLAEAFHEGRLDVGAILVNSDRLGGFLTDRTPTLRETQRHLKLISAIHSRPVAVLSIEHDGPGVPLPKQKKAASGRSARKRALKK